FDRVLPNYVISGCNLLDFQARVHAGLVVGWIHKPVALAVERSYGKGRFVVSTFRLFRAAPGVDPTASVLLDCLLALAMAQGSAASRGRVGVWRSGGRPNISVAAPFVRRCLTGSTMAPFPHPAHRTGHADFPHPALGQDITPSPTTGRDQAVLGVRAGSTRKGAGVDSSRPYVA